MSPGGDSDKYPLVPFVILVSFISLLYFTGVTGKLSVGLIPRKGLEGVGPLEGGKLVNIPVLELNFLRLDSLKLLYRETDCNEINMHTIMT